MIKIDLIQWKQCMEGMSRGDIPSFIQMNRQDGDNSIREYFDGDTVVMRMTVYAANTDAPGYENKRLFEAIKDILQKVSYIYIPTEEEYEQWDERDFQENWSVAAYEIAKQEGRSVKPEDFKR